MAARRSLFVVMLLALSLALAGCFSFFSKDPDPDPGPGQEQNGDGNGGENGDNGGDENLILEELFEAQDADEFLSAAYRSLPGDPDKPMYIRRTGQTSLKVENGVLELIGGQFSIGKKDAALTEPDDETVDGVFDLSKPYRVILEVIAADTNGNLQVYVDNNTTGAANSVHGNQSRIYNTPLPQVQDLVDDNDGLAVIEVSSTVGTATSFVSVRTDGGGSAQIQKIRIEYQ